MCGFAGSLGGENKDKNQNLFFLKKMTDSISYRGPDSEGFWSNPESKIYLGHRRLAILDTSSAGNQPMISQSGRFILVYNGEIYNHLDLRKKLSKQKNHVWRSSCDTETLLACFEKWGVKQTLKESIGMFAFAMWDMKKELLIFARDRAGEKPLYFGWQGIGNKSVLLFGSELKALRQHPSFSAPINREALSGYLSRMAIKKENSIYEGFYKVKPGTIIYVSLKNKKPVQETFWSLNEVITAGKQKPLIMNQTETIDSLQNILEKAITRQMISDVPLGAFLSGGVDSSTVVSLMQKNSIEPIKTFSIGFQEEKYNEAHYARAIANFLNTDHTELYVSSKDALEVIPRLSSIYDEPFSDSSQIPTFLVSKLASEHVKVSLSGDAGDELFGGYKRYLQAKNLWKFITLSPYPFRKLLCERAKDINFSFLNKLSLNNSLNLGDKVSKGLSLLSSTSNLELYSKLISNWRLSDSLVIGISDCEEFNSVIENNIRFEELMMATDTVEYLPEDILTKIDRASMSVSLEGRVPLLDHKVIEFAWEIPFEYKIRRIKNRYVQKWILKEILYRHIPRKLIDRPKKGFSVPIDNWLRGPLRDWAENLINRDRLTQEGYLRPDPIRKKWKEHLSEERNWHSQIWGVLMFQEWLESQKNV